MEPLQHICHPQHPLIFNEERIYGKYCYGCRELISGPSYSCIQCKDFYQHKSCAELPLGLYHPLHPIHPLILFPSWNYADTKCNVCKESRHEYTYCCSRCNFYLHIRCGSLVPTMEAEVYNQPLTLFWKTELQHFSHPEHPLVFIEDERRGYICCGCQEPVLGPSYNCIKCRDFFHHKLCAELPLGLHHPLHPSHPLILFHEETNYGEDKEFSKCQVCKQFRNEYSYRCSHCNFNLHNRCASLPLTMKAEVHDHPLTLLWRWAMFTCNFCGKEGEGLPYSCNPCGFWIHRSCASLPRRVKVIRHNHALNLVHSLQVQFDFPFCRLCVQNVDIDYGLYHCSRCDFIAHVNCAMDERYREDVTLLEEDEDLELNQHDYSTIYKVKKTNVGEDGIEIATEIEHFGHQHDLQLTYEVLNNQKCNGCVRAIFPPFYCCAGCNFFLHKSCVELPKIKRHPLHQHPLTLIPVVPYGDHWFWCQACYQRSNGFIYRCKDCRFELDVQCSLVSDILTHQSHAHRFILSNTGFKQSCSSCGSERDQVFRCTICEFALDFKCATLPHTTRYKQHEHPFTLCYTTEDDSGEYYCDICEEERDPKHWFYYCVDCSYPAHPQCILGKHPNIKFGVSYTFNFHPHPLTFTKETKDHPPCHKCSHPCEESIYQCAECNFNMHDYCV